MIGNSQVMQIIFVFKCQINQQILLNCSLFMNLHQNLKIKHTQQSSNFSKSLLISKNKSYHKDSSQFLKTDLIKQKYIMLSDPQSQQPIDNHIKIKLNKTKKDDKKLAKKIIFLNPKPKTKKINNKEERDRLNQLKYTEPKTNSLVKKKEKRNSLGNEKKNIQNTDVDISKQILKNKIQLKDKQILLFKTNMQKLNSLTIDIIEYSKLQMKLSPQIILTYIKNIVQNEISEIFPVVGRLVQSIMQLLGQCFQNNKIQTITNMNTEAPISPNELTANRILREDIQKLEKQIINLEQQQKRMKQILGRKLGNINEINLIQKLRLEVQQQKQQLLQLYQMQQQLQKYKAIVFKNKNSYTHQQQS